MAKPSDRWQHFRRRMPSSSLRRVTRCVQFGSLYACVACGATGLDWVGEAHLESASQQQVNVVHASTFGAANSASIPATAEENESRPRLNRTVTLGEVDVAPTQSDTSRAGFPGPSVVVNNYNQVNVVTPAFGYGSYGYSRGSARFSPGFVSPYRPSSGAPSPLPGQNWPAVADHGPSFPYQATPAVPWTRTQ